MRWLDETADDWPASMEQAYDLPDYPIDMNGQGMYVDLFSEGIWCGRMVTDGSGVDVLPPLAGDMTEYTRVALRLRQMHAEGLDAGTAWTWAATTFGTGQINAFSVPRLSGIDPKLKED